MLVVFTPWNLANIINKNWVSFFLPEKPGCTDMYQHTTGICYPKIKQFLPTWHHARHLTFVMRQPGQHTPVRHVGCYNIEPLSFRLVNNCYPIDSQWESAECLREFKPVLSDNREGWKVEGRLKREGHLHTYG